MRVSLKQEVPLLTKEEKKEVIDSIKEGNIYLTDNDIILRNYAMTNILDIPVSFDVALLLLFSPEKDVNISHSDDKKLMIYITKSFCEEKIIPYCNSSHFISNYENWSDWYLDQLKCVIEKYDLLYSLNEEARLLFTNHE